MYLNCHSCFSFRYGVMTPAGLLQQAVQNQITSLALTDINSTSGIPDFFRLATACKIKPVAGIEFRNGHQLCFIGLARNQEGFRELNDFLSYHLHHRLPFEERAPRLFNSFIIYPFQPAAERKLRDNEYIGVRPCDLPRLPLSPWHHRQQQLVMLAPVTFRNKTDFNTHRLLRAIDNNTLLSKLPACQQARADEVMRHRYELIRLYGHYPQIIDNTLQLLDACHIDFEFGKNKNKKTFTGNLYEDELLLRRLCAENLTYRYPSADKTISERYEKEISMITSLGYAAYFLINWDIVQYARHKNYFCTGRGSGANSMVAYLLGITDVDPIDLDLYFERFINPQRTSPPDFDLDFNWDERDDVIDYIFKKYGHTHTAQLAVYNTFQQDSAVRELGKVFGLPKTEIDALAEERIPSSTPDGIVRLILQYARQIHDLPNYLSIHSGGILISELPIHYYSATSIPPKGFPLVHFSMLEAEDLGLYKFDILSQRGLGKIRDAVELIRQNRQVDVDIHDIKKIKEDVKVREHLQQANLMGCFYVESPAMRMLLKKLGARTYRDLVAASSIIRPGVSQSGMMREYILRFHDPQRRTYIHPMMKELLEETFGVMVYQEDVIKVAHYFAGLTLTEADLLRRGMSGKYRGRAEFEKVKDTFFRNCRQKGYPQQVTAEVWRQMESFAGYAFAKGHSASYAVESYQCMYLKAHFPLEYMVACINNGGGFYDTEFYVHEARLCGGIIHAPDINRSCYHTTLNGQDIFLGFHLVHDLEEKTIERILKTRTANGPFTSLHDFMKRVEISIEQLQLLIRVNAFRFTGRTKQQLLWDIYKVLGHEKKTRPEKLLFEPEDKHFTLPSLLSSGVDDAWDEMELLGFPLCSPFDLITSPPAILSPDGKNPGLIHQADEMKNHHNKVISIIGYLVTRKLIRTQRGEQMAFGTFLDRSGQWIDTTHFPDVLEQFPFRGRGCYLITGRVVEEFGFYSLEVIRMEKIPYKPRYSSCLASKVQKADLSNI
jgi:DNA polymerase-3 subunit alpha